MYRLVVSVLLCSLAASCFAMGAEEGLPKKSSIDPEVMLVIRNAVISNNTKEVIRIAELLYSVEGIGLIKILNRMLSEIGIQNDATRAGRYWCSAFQKIEVSSASKRALPANPSLIWAQHIFDAIEDNNSDQLIEILETMIDKIGFVPALHIMNIMIANLAHESLLLNDAYTRLVSCFQLLSPQSHIKLPMPIVSQQQGPVKHQSQQKESAAAAQHPISQNDIVNTRASLKHSAPIMHKVVSQPVLHYSLKPVSQRQVACNMSMIPVTKGTEKKTQPKISATEQKPVAQAPRVLKTTMANTKLPTVSPRQKAAVRITAQTLQEQFAQKAHEFVSPKGKTIDAQDSSLDSEWQDDSEIPSGYSDKASAQLLFNQSPKNKSVIYSG